MPGVGLEFLHLMEIPELVQQVTYKRIQEHLQRKYRCKFGYGTIVQMCVARNKQTVCKKIQGSGQNYLSPSEEGFLCKNEPRCSLE